jgi:hypothetical protein
MKDTFSVALPFFFLISLGYGACRLGWLSESSISGMNSFVLFFALPCMLYRFGCEISVEILFNPFIFLIYSSTALIVLAICVGVSFRLDPKMPWRDVAMGALIASFPNTGFLGLPFLTRLLGLSAAVPIMISIFIDMVMTSSICIFMAHFDRAGGVSPSDAIKRQVAQVLKNPLPWAILLGVSHSYFQIEFLPGIQKSIGLLSDAASPVALFALGGVLARTSPDLKGASSLNHWSLVVIKLVIHPAILFAGLHVLSSTEVGVSPTDQHFLAVVLVLVGGLPSASNVILLSEKLGANGHRLSKVILTTTVLSLLTLPVLSALIQGHLK